MITKRLWAPLAVAACLVLSGCISITSYVDPTLGDVKPEQRVTVANPKPVQLVFEFQTKGALSARATKEIAPQVKELVATSGNFSEVSSEPVANGALLAITINNVPEENAAGQGFATGLTLGLAGSTVTDFYVATAKYAASAGSATTTAETKHALHSVVGAGGAPNGLTASKSPVEAVSTVMRQIVQHLLNDIAKAQTAAASSPAAALSVAAAD